MLYVGRHATVTGLKLERMKYSLPFFFVLGLLACKNQANDKLPMQAQIDSLQNKLNNSYKPGFGEFMSSIQMHHAKLWFAGQNQNWKLANFEIDEIKESLADINLFCTNRPEISSIGMINPAIDSITNSIQQENFSQFKTGYVLLTSTCNNCHRATNHEFNVIKIPDIPPVTNQEFRIQNVK